MIGVYRTSSEGAEIIYNLLVNEGYSVEWISQEIVEQGQLSIYELVVFPGAHEHVFAFLSSGKFRRMLRRYLLNGGKYVGFCGGAAVGVWAVKGFSLFEGLKFLKSYLYFLVVGRTSFLVVWNLDNMFGKVGLQEMTWAGGPPIELEDFKIEALFAESKPFVPYKDKPAIASGKYGEGCLVLFSPHPEYREDTLDLILRAING